MSDTNADIFGSGRVRGESQFAGLSFLQQINWALQNSAFDSSSQGNWLLNRDILYWGLFAAPLQLLCQGGQWKQLSRSSFYYFCSELWTFCCYKNMLWYFFFFYFALFSHFLLSDKFSHTQISYLYLTFLLNTLSSVCRRPCHCRALLKAC